MTKQQCLDQIKADILAKNICPDLAKTAKQLVFGEGNPSADIVFIGEAPGKNEDIQGLPFVGASGKFLSEMLALIDLKREDIYITNIVKYRPPNNRDPLPSEKQAFLPFLQAQLQVIKPKLIVTLGRHSMNALLPSVSSCASCSAGGPPELCSGRVNNEHRKDDVVEATSSAEHNYSPTDVRSGGASRLHAGRACDTTLIISQAHGQLMELPKNFGKTTGRSGASAMLGANEQRTEPYHEYGKGVAQLATQQRAASWAILPLYHPASALYNGSKRQTLIDDFIKIPIIIKELQESEK